MHFYSTSKLSCELIIFGFLILVCGDLTACIIEFVNRAKLCMNPDTNLIFLSSLRAEILKSEYAAVLSKLAIITTRGFEFRPVLLCKISLLVGITFYYRQLKLWWCISTMEKRLGPPSLLYFFPTQSWLSFRPVEIFLFVNC